MRLSRPPSSPSRSQACIDKTEVPCAGAERLSGIRRSVRPKPSLLAGGGFQKSHPRSTRPLLAYA